MKENRKKLDDGALENVTGGDKYWVGNAPGSQCPNCGGYLDGENTDYRSTWMDGKTHISICGNCGNRYNYYWYEYIPICY